MPSRCPAMAPPLPRLWCPWVLSLATNAWAWAPLPLARGTMAGIACRAPRLECRGPASVARGLRQQHRTGVRGGACVESGACAEALSEEDVAWALLRSKEGFWSGRIDWYDFDWESGRFEERGLALNMKVSAEFPPETPHEGRFVVSNSRKEGPSRTVQLAKSRYLERGRTDRAPSTPFQFQSGVLGRVPPAPGQDKGRAVEGLEHNFWFPQRRYGTVLFYSSSLRLEAACSIVMRREGGAAGEHDTSNDMRVVAELASELPAALGAQACVGLADSVLVEAAGGERIAFGGGARERGAAPAVERKALCGWLQEAPCPELASWLGQLGVVPASYAQGPAHAAASVRAQHEGEGRVVQVLPGGVLVCAPTQLGPGTRLTLCRAEEGGAGAFLATELRYDERTVLSEAVSWRMRVCGDGLGSSTLHS